MLASDHATQPAALDQFCEHMLYTADLVQPPYDMLELARRLELVVAKDDRQTTRARLVRLSQNAAILLKSEPRPERRQWAIAHEIGEHLAQQAFDQLGLDTSDSGPTSRERLASAVATRLLLPKEQFAGDALESDLNLHRLKMRYSTASHELIAKRFLDLDVPVVVTIFDHGKMTFRQSSNGTSTRKLLNQERSAQEKSHRDSTPTRFNGSIRIDAWPIHEPGWKREILITTNTENDD